MLQGLIRAVLMGTKSCTKILIFSTRFSCDDFGILVYALLCGGDTKFKLPKAGNGDVFFPNKRVRFDKAVALQYHNQ